MLWPTSGPVLSTSISTLYSRGSAIWLMAGRRSGSSRSVKSSRNTMPTMATGMPTGAMLNRLRWMSSPISMLATTRLVLVPIRAQVPPRTVA